MRLAIIGGTGIDEMAGFVSGEGNTVTTRYGDAYVVECEFAGRQIIFLPRHGLEHNIPPSLINYRAQIAALKKIGVDRVIGVSAVGSLRTDLPAGAFAVLNDFIDLTKRRQSTFFDQKDKPIVHTDFSCPYCPEVSDALRTACRLVNAVFEPKATYIGVEGPRYESPAEIRLYANWGGHVVGMTNVPEVVLAREAALCYGAIAVVANLACGLSEKPLSHDEVRAAVKSAGSKLGQVLENAIITLPTQTDCLCSSAGIDIFS